MALFVSRGAAAWATTAPGYSTYEGISPSRSPGGSGAPTYTQLGSSATAARAGYHPNAGTIGRQLEKKIVLKTLSVYKCVIYYCIAIVWRRFVALANTCRASGREQSWQRGRRCWSRRRLRSFVGWSRSSRIRIGV